MDYKRINEMIMKLKQVYERVGADVGIDIATPANMEEIEAVEKELGMRLPEQLRDFFLNYSASCEFSAWLPDEFELPEELDEIFSAIFLISLDEIVNAEDSRKEWVKACFSDADDEYDAVWYNKLGLMTVGNGDVIALDIGVDKTNPPVVYLSHDDGEGHGYILGKDFETYFQNLLMVGACGNEDWQMLPFCEDEQSGIDANCENAKEYRNIIGLQL